MTDNCTAANANKVFDLVVATYHEHDDVDAKVENPYENGSFEHTLFAKCWIDAVQWHLEDIIRDPQIDPVAALALKRRIDRSNQERTDMVEEIDTYFRQKYACVAVGPDATINTESPAWAFDRLSILALKIYHMQAETMRSDAAEGGTLPRETRHVVGAASGSDHGYRPASFGYCRRTKIYEGVQANENV